MIPMCRPLLPPTHRLTPYLHRIDATRWYSNAGPLVTEYEKRLETIFNCHVVAVSSGTAGLIAAIASLNFKKDHKISIPSWTFVATANAVRAAGYDIKFEDVDEVTWESKTHLGVSPFGRPKKYMYGIIDAAAGFDSYARGIAQVGESPVVISTHATKCFSTGEGGLVLSTDESFIGWVREFINNGLTLNREVKVSGINGKMSEYHAAVGLAEIDGWGEKREKWLKIKAMYLEMFKEFGGWTPLESLEWVGPNFAIRLPGTDIRPIIEKLKEKGITARQVWGRGVHRYEAYENCERTYLSVTEKLADEVLFLPFSVDTSFTEAEYIYRSVQECL